MSEAAVEISSFVITNKLGVASTLVLEPEGDCIDIAAGQACRIVPAASSSSKLDCELVVGPEGSITLYLSIVKEVYINSVKVR
jgi:hypothetical protein